MCVSTGFTPAALMRTTISPAPGFGSGTSSSFNSSGPPKRCTRMAFMAAVIVDDERGLRRERRLLGARAEIRDRLDLDDVFHRQGTHAHGGARGTRIAEVRFVNFVETGEILHVDEQNGDVNDVGHLPAGALHHSFHIFEARARVLTDVVSGIAALAISR